jgi:hypothetical protein
MSAETEEIATLDDLTRRMLKKSKVDLSSLPKVFKNNGRTRLPLASNEEYLRTLENGRQVKCRLNCADKNPQYTYALLKEDTARKPDWQGYQPVHRSNPGGQHILETEFDESGLIRVGDAFWHYAPTTYRESAKNEYRDRGNRAQYGFTEGPSTQHENLVNKTPLQPVVMMAGADLTPGKTSGSKPTTTGKG